MVGHIKQPPNERGGNPMGQPASWGAGDDVALKPGYPVGGQGG